MSRDRRSRGTLEQEVFALLAASGSALTPAEVRQRLGGRLAYTTVMTVLARMAEKGVLTRRRSGRGFAYAAVPDEAEITARQMQRLLDGQEDRAAVLARFVGVLNPDDGALLAGLLSRAEERS